MRRLPPHRGPLAGAPAALCCALLLAALGSCRARPPAGGEAADTSGTAGSAAPPAGAADPAGKGEESAATPEEGASPEAGPSADEGPSTDRPQTEGPTFLAEANRRDVTLFFQNPEGDLQGAERRTIFETNSVADQAKQIVVEVINGPERGDLLPTLPRETRVLGLFLDRAGTAYVNLSEEVSTLHPGGAAEEIATVFSIVNSLTFNLPAIKRVHFLIGGEERETLKNHLDLQRDFVREMSIVRRDDSFARRGGVR